MRTSTKASLVAMFIGFGAATVGAQPYAPPPQATHVVSDNVVQVYQKKYKMNHKKWVYSEKYGHRYRHRRHGYTYFYDGYYYPRPYWRPGVTIQLGL